MKFFQSRISGLILMLAVLAGCTTNSLVIGFFYGRLDDRMAERILETADFSATQRDEIQQAVDGFFEWHRSTELPRYGDVLDQVAVDIDQGKVNEAAVLDRMQQVRSFAADAFQRSPFANSADFLANLTDSQIDQIAEYFDERDEEFREWLEERQAAGGDDKRVDGIVKNIGRFGVNLNEEQREIISSSLADLEGSPEDRHALWNRWETEFLEILQNRNAAGFHLQVNAHLAEYQEQMRIHRPGIYEKNQAVVAAMVSDVLNSLDPRQRATLLARLAQTRKSLRKVAAG